MLRETTKCCRFFIGAMNCNLRLPKHILLWLCLLTMSQVVVAQVFPLPEQNPEWIVSTNGLAGPSEERFTLSGEYMTIRGEEWPVVQKTVVQDFILFLDTITSPVGAYFVDGDKVYFKDLLFGYEGLLFDFSAEIGDTFFIVSPGTSSIDSVEVTVVDRELTNCGDEGMMRTIYLHITGLLVDYNLVWKEGMGAVHYPFISEECIHPNCDIVYESNKLILHGDTIVVAENNDCLTSDEHLETASPLSLSIYPNPTSSGFISLTTDGLGLNGTSVDVVIINQLGQHVKQWEGQIHDGISTNIDLQGIRAGSYFVVLQQSSNPPLTRKLIITD